MKAMTFKSKDELGYPVNHICYINEGNYVYCRRHLVPVKLFESYTLKGFDVIKTYKNLVYLQRCTVFYPETFQIINKAFRRL